ncbi:MAG: hypothetical protein AAFX87_29940 [Bacteroidota bacterium]
MKIIIRMALILIACYLMPEVSQAQFLKKAKEKIRQGNKIIKDVQGKGDKKDNGSGGTSGNPSSTGGNSGGVRNNKGGGLKMTPPDVMENINDASSSVGSSNYRDARFAIQEALRGVELEIGHEILNSFPSTVEGMPFNEDNDEIVTNGVGFVGLNIGRKYTGNDEEARVAVSNNSMMISSVNAYLTSSAYANSSNGEFKRTKVQGFRALLEYSDYDGYKLSVPIGQSALFLLQCVNFQSEDEVMSAANAFNLTEIKNLLGEN